MTWAHAVWLTKAHLHMHVHTRIHTHTHMHSPGRNLWQQGLLQVRISKLIRPFASFTHSLLSILLRGSQGSRLDAYIGCGFVCLQAISPSRTYRMHPVRPPTPQPCTCVKSSGLLRPFLSPDRWCFRNPDPACCQHAHSAKVEPSESHACH